MPILYFTDDQSSVPSHVQSLFRRHVGRDIIAHGPNGGAGKLYGDAAYWQDRHFGLDAERHKFTKIGNLWYCLAESDYQPKDLAKAELVDGESIELAGKQWTVPLFSSLPKTLTLTESGNWLPSGYRPEHRDFANASIDVWNKIKANELSNGDMWDYCCLALGVNYKVRREEVSILGLLDDDSAESILIAALGLERKDDGA